MADRTSSSPSPSSNFSFNLRISTAVLPPAHEDGCSVITDEVAEPRKRTARSEDQGRRRRCRVHGRKMGQHRRFEAGSRGSSLSAPTPPFSSSSVLILLPSPPSLASQLPTTSKTTVKRLAGREALPQTRAPLPANSFTHHPNLYRKNILKKNKKKKGMVEQSGAGTTWKKKGGCIRHQVQRKR
ncbi:hypothetical protein ACFX2B_014375 [Malus domestica]